MLSSPASRPNAPQRHLTPEPAHGEEQVSCAAAVCFRFLGARLLEHHSCNGHRLAGASRRLAVGGFPLAAMSTPPRPLFVRIHPSPAE